MILEISWLACHNPENWLENRRSENDKVSRRVCKTMEAKVGKTRVAKTKGKRKKPRAEEGERKKKEEKTKKRENNRSKEDSREVENFGWKERSSKVWRRGQEIGFLKIL